MLIVRLESVDSCRNLRSRRFLTVCTGCYLCKARATYVNLGCDNGAEV